jgi:hypothetical protein
MPIGVAPGGDVGRDQDPRIGPQPRRRRVLELPAIHIQHRAAQVAPVERIRQSVLIEDLPAGDIDHHAARLHPGKPAGIEQTVGLRRPLAADRHHVAVRQVFVELRRAAKCCETLRLPPVRRSRAAGADDPHAQRGAQPPNLLADAVGTNDADGLPLQQQRPVVRRTERPRQTIRGCPGQALGDVHDPSHRISAIGSALATPREVATVTPLPHRSPRSRLLAPAGRWRYHFSRGDLARRSSG